MDARLDRIAKALATRRATLGAIALVAGAARALPAAQPAGAKKKKTCNACCAKKKQTYAQLQFLHASPNAPAADVYADGVPVAMALAYGERTALATYDSGPVRIAIVGAGGDPDSPVLDLTETLDACRSFLFVVGGTVPEMTGRALLGLQGFLFSQYRSKIKDAAVARATAIHLSPDGPVIGVRLEAAGVGSRGLGGYVLATNIAYGDQSAPQEMPAGAYDVVAYDPVTEAVLARVENVVLAGTALTQIAVIDRPGGAPGLTAVPVANPTCCGTY